MFLTTSRAIIIVTRKIYREVDEKWVFFYVLRRGGGYLILSLLFELVFFFFFWCLGLEVDVLCGVELS